MLDVFVADDSVQGAPTRARMSRLVGMGGLHIPGGNVRGLEDALRTLKGRFGFPDGEEFKWSPGRDAWMREELVGGSRTRFYKEAVETAGGFGCTALIVIEDASMGRATGTAVSAELDVATMLIERIDHVLRQAGADGVVLVDEPGGGAAAEREFMATCARVLQEGTTYHRPERIALPIITGSSRSIGVLQLADLITGATLAFVGGESSYSPPVFEALKPLIGAGADGNQGGSGLKIHPDYIFGNLYHWLLGQTNLRSGGGAALVLPSPGRPFARSPNDD